MDPEISQSMAESLAGLSGNFEDYNSNTLRRLWAHAYVSSMQSLIIVHPEWDALSVAREARTHARRAEEAYVDEFCL